MTTRLRPYERTVVTNVTVRVDDMDPHDLEEAFRQVVDMLTEGSVTVLSVNGADGLVFFARHTPRCVWFLDTEDPFWLQAAGPRLSQVYDNTKQFVFTYEQREYGGQDLYFLVASMKEDDPDASPD